MAKWAKGKWARACCDRCGFAYPWKDMKKELSGLWVCEECYDGKYQLLNHPANKPAPFRPDAPLKRPRPDAEPETPPQLVSGTLEQPFLDDE